MFCCFQNGMYLIRKSTQGADQPYTLQIYFNGKDFNLPVKKSDGQYSVGNNTLVWTVNLLYSKFVYICVNIPPTIKVFWGVYRNHLARPSVHPSIFLVSSTLPKLMKLFSVEVFYQRLCMKEYKTGPKNIKRENSREIIIYANWVIVWDFTYSSS